MALLEDIRSAAEAEGLKELDWKVDGNHDALTFQNPETGQLFLFSIRPGPMVFAWTYATAPLVPDERLSQVVTAITQAVPHIRLGLRNDGDRMTALFDTVMGVDPDEPVVRPNRFRRVLETLETAPHAAGLMPPSVRPPREPASPERDAELTERVIERLRSDGLRLKRPEGDAGVVYVWEPSTDPLTCVVFVRDETLFVHRLRHVPIPAEDQPDLVWTLQNSPHFGRTILNVGEPGMLALEYTHFIDGELTDFDLYHSLAAANTKARELDELLERALGE
jgi:hypothetical protein